MASYGDLTKEERAVWDEYQTLREISDWPAFDSKQQSRKEDCASLAGRSPQVDLAYGSAQEQGRRRQRLAS
jgi:hypothetical protein